MATAFTHAFVAGSLAGLPRHAPERFRLVLAAAACGVWPDVDVIAFALGIPYDHPWGHRGATHSIAFAIATGLVVAWFGFRRGAGDRRWLGIAALLAVATASHGILDAFTDAGLGIAFAWPFDDARHFAPWRPLATSPIGISRFFDGPALAILSNEFVWVGLPWTGFLIATAWVRRRPAPRGRGRRAATRRG